MIIDRTNKSGDVDPVVFNRLPTWWIITSGGVPERSWCVGLGFSMNCDYSTLS